MTGFEILGKILHRLTNNFKAADKSTLQGFIGQKRFPVECLRTLQQIFGFDQNMFQILVDGFKPGLLQDALAEDGAD